MSILSLPAVARLAERHCRQHGQPVPRAALVKQLEALNVDHDRAHAGVNLGVISGRLVDTPSGLAIPTFDEGMTRTTDLVANSSCAAQGATLAASERARRATAPNSTPAVTTSQLAALPVAAASARPAAVRGGRGGHTRQPHDDGSHNNAEGRQKGSSE